MNVWSERWRIALDPRSHGLLHQLMEQRRLSESIRADHSPESTFGRPGNGPASTVWSWTSVAPTEPADNAFIGWFNGTLRQERLHWGQFLVHGGGSGEDGILANILHRGDTPQCARQPVSPEGCCTGKNVGLTQCSYSDFRRKCSRVISMMVRSVAWSPRAGAGKLECLVEFSKPVSVIALAACIAVEFLAPHVVRQTTVVKIAILDVVVCRFHHRRFVR